MARKDEYTALRRAHIAEYNALKNAIHRCHNENNIAYSNYGARGRRVQDELRTKEGLQLMIDAIGPRPSPQHSLDRIDNDGDYTISPLNLRWADRRTQNNNRRAKMSPVQDFGWGFGYVRSGKGRGGCNSPLLPHNGQMKTLCAWCKELGLKPATVRQRLQRGKSVSEALDPTLRKNFKRKLRPEIYLDSKRPN